MRIRLAHYDYTDPGAYFVTICTQNRECLFGDIVDGKMVLNDAGRMAERCWNDIPGHHPHIKLDVFQIMLNHVHGILIISCTLKSIATTTVGRHIRCPYR